MSPLALRAPAFICIARLRSPLRTKLIAEPCRETIGAIGACTIGDNDFGSGRPLAQMGEKWLYQRRLIKNWNNNRDLHLTTVAGTPVDHLIFARG